MARIRTVKPEFWTDSVVVQLPFEARLLFIGIWNFCDDQGFFVSEPERLRMQVFPSEPSIGVASLLDLLVATDRLEMFTSADGDALLRVKNFGKHQRVDNPSKPRFAGAKKRSIPASVRRAVADKYGCAPGSEKEVTCFYCGCAGTIRWWNLSDGRPSSWVSFSLELDHVEAESAGGDGESKNIVLACRSCNRSKATKEFAEMWPSLATPIEPSPPEGKRNGREGKGKEGKGNLPAVAALPAGKTVPTRLAYEKEYRVRWKSEPLTSRVEDGKTITDKTANGQLTKFVDLIGAQDAPAVAEFFVRHNQALYVNAKHPIGLLLRDAQKLKTEWQTNTPMTPTKALQVERTQENASGWAAMLKEKPNGME